MLIWRETYNGGTVLIFESSDVASDSFPLPLSPFLCSQNTAKAMKSMNKAVNVKTITKMMAEFERENAKTEMMQEVMGDAIDDALGDEEGEEEEEKIVNQVLDEIGISFGEELPEAAGLSTPSAATEGPTKVAEPAGGDDSALNDLEARLNNLKR